MVAAPAHFIVADIRHYAQPARQNGTNGPVPPFPGYAYGPTVPMQTPVQPPMHQFGQQPPVPQPYTPPYQQPHSTPQPQPTPPAHQPHPTPHPQRLDQVRAELDELSDYLRKEEGR